MMSCFATDGNEFAPLHAANFMQADWVNIGHGCYETKASSGDLNQLLLSLKQHITRAVPLDRTVDQC